MRKQFIFILILFFLLGLVPINFSNAANLATRLKGKILLQVESMGEAWYVNPDNEKRYYLGKPADAFHVMRELGLGISESNYDSFNGYAPPRLAGKILLRVEASGEAYYVNPADFKIHYLGKPLDAFQVMRELGLGITNNDLNKILEKWQIDTSNLKLLNNAKIIEQLKDSVVYIETKDSSGSGFIVESNGYILTNAHVVQGVSSVSVILSNNTTLSASVVGRDENIDLALLKVNQVGLKKSALGDSDAVKQGDEIFTLGYPFGIKGDVSFKEGTVSRTLKSDDYEYFETSADIHPGNSGGPLVNKYGQVIGINTAIFGESIQGVSVGETIKLAIPINIVKNILPDLKNGRNVVNEIVHKEIEEKKIVEPTQCDGNISSLQLIGGSKYSLYDLYNYDHDLYGAKNNVKITGTIKNSSSCEVNNVKIKITIWSENNSDLKQEETVAVLKNSNYRSSGFSIAPSNSAPYKVTITAYDTFITDEYGYSSVTKQELREGVSIKLQLISADWLSLD